MKNDKEIGEASLETCPDYLGRISRMSRQVLIKGLLLTSSESCQCTDRPDNTSYEDHTEGSSVRIKRSHGSVQIGGERSVGSRACGGGRVSRGVSRGGGRGGRGR